MKDYIEAHKYSSNHRNKLETDVNVAAITAC